MAPPVGFLKPAVLGFTLTQALHTLIDKVTGKPCRPLQSVAFVRDNAPQGDPQAVLAALDRFATEVRWMMSIGPEKDLLIQDLAGRLPRAPRVLELGAYAGYSSIFMGATLDPTATITSVEISGDNVEASRQNIEWAGLAERITVIEGSSTKVIPTLQGHFDMVFLDHWKNLYLGDLQLMEAHGLLKPGSIVVADNVGEFFGAEPYLQYVRESGKFDSENRVATIEYTSLPDAVEISVLR